MKYSDRRFLKQLLFYLGGDQPPVSWLERIRSVLGAFIGLMLVFATSKYLGELSGIDEWLMASLGASALLVFALPGSPMAQPWAVIAGNTLSALVGISCFNLIGQPLLALPAAVSLIVVLGHIGGYRYAFPPVMVDSVLLVLAGAVYSNLTGKPYPNKPSR
jgi:CBS domain-containing membrane protein